MAIIVNGLKASHPDFKLRNTFMWACWTILDDVVLPCAISEEALAMFAELTLDPEKK